MEHKMEAINWNLGFIKIINNLTFNIINIIIIILLNIINIIILIINIQLFSN